MAPERAMMQTPVDPIEELAPYGVLAFTTTRAAGTFGLAGSDPVGEVMGRWTGLLADMAAEAGAARGICVAPQVHGSTILAHATPWDGFLRTGPADGHVALEHGIALAVTVADCAPVFIVHPPTRAVAIVHSGWRGTEAKIIHEAVRALARAGIAPDELHVHVGPAICGRCYEVSADVRSRLTGKECTRSGNVDLRALIAEDAQTAGAGAVTMSPSCTRCDNETFFSHRAGDAGRQIGVIVARRL